MLRKFYHTLVRGGLQKYTVTINNPTGNSVIFQKQHEMFLERMINPIQLFMPKDKFIFVRHETESHCLQHKYIFYIHVDEIPLFEQRINHTIDAIKHKTH